MRKRYPGFDGANGDVCHCTAVSRPKVPQKGRRRGKKEGGSKKGARRTNVDSLSMAL